jgi:hypothetical protein
MGDSNELIQLRRHCMYSRVLGQYAPRRGAQDVHVVDEPDCYAKIPYSVALVAFHYAFVHSISLSIAARAYAVAQRNSSFPISFLHAN